MEEKENVKVLRCRSGASLLCILSIYILSIYICYLLIPKHSFTCSNNHKYSWCTKYKPINITVIGYENNKLIGQYTKLLMKYNCEMNGFPDQLEINNHIDGYYKYNNINLCFSQKNRDDYIMSKDKHNRFTVIVWISVPV